MTIFVFDTETTGLPTKTNGFENCRMVEIAYKIFTDGGDEIKSYQTVIKPENYEITNSDFHGITHEYAREKGTPISEFFETLSRDIKNVTLIVGHNVMFDISVLLNECKVNNQDEIANKIMTTECRCTMYMGQLKYKTTRFPRLVDLYKQETGEELVNAHSALADCSATAKCYFSLIKK